MISTLEAPRELDRHLDPYFYSLVNEAKPKQKRTCLRCRKEFYSSHSGNRCCGACAARNAREPFKADYLIMMH